MVIDTSAVVAILLEEPGFERFIDSIAADPVRLISAVNALESAIVIEARKGDHPAGLNFCDCCTYALAKVSGKPLLFQGGDFPRTDDRGLNAASASAVRPIS